MNETDYSKYTVLVVDDIPVNVMLVKGMLSKLNFNIASANSGQQALELLTRVRPDVILMDIMMPGMNGFETTRAIRANAATKDIPVIILSALNSDSDIKEGLEAGANEFITKPFIQERIVNSILNQIKLSESSRVQKENGASKCAGYDTLVRLLAFMTGGRKADAVWPLADAALCLPVSWFDDSFYSLPDHSPEKLTEWMTNRIQQADVNLIQVTIAESLSHVQSILKPLAGQRKLAFRTDLPEHINVAVDEDLFQAILINLLSYAYRKAEKEIEVKGYVDGGLANIAISFTLDTPDATEGQEAERRTQIAMEAAMRMNGVVVCEHEDGRYTFQIILQL